MMKSISILTTLLVATTAHAGDPPALANNPFSRPPVPEVIDEVRHGSEITVDPVLLTATMVSGSRAIAHVEGKVIRPGDEVRGYLLRRVYEDRAVFERNGNEIIVYVKPDPEEDDEPTTPKRR